MQHGRAVSEWHLAVYGFADDGDLVRGFAANVADDGVERAEEDGVKDGVGARLCQPLWDELVGRTDNTAQQLWKDEHYIQIDRLPS